MDLDEFLRPLAPDRREAVKAWLASSLGDCVSCGAPVLVSQGHETRDKGFAHRSCPDASAETADESPLPANVVANAARSDWG